MQALASDAKDVTECPYYTHIHYEPKKKRIVDMCQEIKDALAKGHFVRLSGYDVKPRDEDIEWTVESLEDYFGLKPDQVLQALGELFIWFFFAVLLLRIVFHADS